MARELGRDCTTVSKEVRLRRISKCTGAYGRAFNDCLQRRNCPQTGVAESALRFVASTRQ
ncbi:MAG: hypothetical protein LBO82_05545 [Synergistaceae bacterium]|nr:hypothetical protein [Synergistaceae bacterium]